MHCHVAFVVAVFYIWLMKALELNSYIHIDEYSSTPKYKQLVNAIYLAIEKGILQKNTPLPSINELSFKLELSRDTAEKGYRQLRNLGIIESVPGKGYFIADTNFSRKIKVCLLFNKLSAHKKIIYDSFVDTLGDDAMIDLYIYNNSFPLFKKLLADKKEDYTHYVIIPHFLDASESPAELINQIDKDKLVMLDKCLPEITGTYSGVYQNFHQDIYNALCQALEPLSKYSTIKLVFPQQSYFPIEIVEGFRKFCNQYAFNYEIIGNLEKNKIEKGQAYITLTEDDLVSLAEQTIDTNLEIGLDIGIISYNETPLKRLILKGITTISTDFEQLGCQAAKALLATQKVQIHVPFYFKLRNSL